MNKEEGVESSKKKKENSWMKRVTKKIFGRKKDKQILEPEENKPDDKRDILGSPSLIKRSLRSFGSGDDSEKSESPIEKSISKFGSDQKHLDPVPCSKHSDLKEVDYKYNGQAQHNSKVDEENDDDVLSPRKRSIIDSLSSMRSSGSGEGLDSTASLGNVFKLVSQTPVVIHSNSATKPVSETPFDPEGSALNLRMDKIMRRISESTQEAESRRSSYSSMAPPTPIDISPSVTVLSDDVDLSPFSSPSNTPPRTLKGGRKRLPRNEKDSRRDSIEIATVVGVEVGFSVMDEPSSGSGTSPLPLIIPCSDDTNDAYIHSDDGNECFLEDLIVPRDSESGIVDRDLLTKEASPQPSPSLTKLCSRSSGGGRIVRPSTDTDFHAAITPTHTTKRRELSHHIESKFSGVDVDLADNKENDVIVTALSSSHDVCVSGGNMSVDEFETLLRQCPHLGKVGIYCIR